MNSGKNLHLLRCKKHKLNINSKFYIKLTVTICQNDGYLTVAPELQAV